MKKTVTMNIEYDDRVSTVKAADFIKDSLSWAGGCRRPDDPLFSSMKVTCVRVRSKG